MNKNKYICNFTHNIVNLYIHVLYEILPNVFNKISAISVQFCIP